MKLSNKILVGFLGQLRRYNVPKDIPSLHKYLLNADAVQVLTKLSRFSRPWCLQPFNERFH